MLEGRARKDTGAGAARAKFRRNFFQAERSLFKTGQSEVLRDARDDSAVCASVLVPRQGRIRDLGFEMPDLGNDFLGSPVGCYRIKAVRPHGAGAAGWPFAGKPVMKMLPSSVEEGVGGGADCDLIFLASGDNHAALGAPPLLNREGSYHEHFHPSWRTTQEGKKSCLAVGWRVGISFGFCGQGGLSRRCGEVGSIIQRHHAPNSFLVSNIFSAAFSMGTRRRYSERGGQDVAGEQTADGFMADHRDVPALMSLRHFQQKWLDSFDEVHAGFASGGARLPGSASQAR